MTNTKKAEPHKTKRLSVKRVTVKDLAVKAQKGEGIRGGRYTDSCKGPTD